MRHVGFQPFHLRTLGYTLQELVRGGFSPDAFRGAGYSASEFRAANVGGFQAAAAGFTKAEMLAAGFHEFECPKHLAHSNSSNPAMRLLVPPPRRMRVRAGE